MFEAVFQAFCHEVNPLAARFQKSHAHFWKLIKYASADYGRVSHQGHSSIQRSWLADKQERAWDTRPGRQFFFVHQVETLVDIAQLHTGDRIDFFLA
jgi:hypothetical protein